MAQARDVTRHPGRRASTRRPNVCVVGHVEWVDFVRVESLPRAGDIVPASHAWAEAGGGGAVAAVRLAELAGEATLLTALGSDELGPRARDELTRLGVRVEAATRDEPQRRAVVYVDAAGERTITLLSHKLRPRRSDPLPWSLLEEADGVYFTGGDAEALRAARGARVLVATARELATLGEASVPLDALVGSASDEDERYRPGDLDPVPQLVVRTEGSSGGIYAIAGQEERRFEAAALSAPVCDTYGAGDSFAAGLTFALAQGRPPDEAVAFAAECGAAAVVRRGAHGGPATR